MTLSHIIIKIVADFLFLIVVVGAFIAMVRLPKKVRKEYIIRGLLAGIIAETIGQIASHLYHHAPPFAVLKVEALAWHVNNINSFPSDHMMLVSAATFVAWASTRNHRLGLSLLIISIIVGAGRVYAHVHWPTDIIASLIIAAIVTLIVFSIPYKGSRPLKQGSTDLSSQD